MEGIGLGSIWDFVGFAVFIVGCGGFYSFLRKR